MQDSIALEMTVRMNFLIARAFPMLFVRCHPEWRDEFAFGPDLSVVAATDRAVRALATWTVEIGLFSDAEAKGFVDMAAALAAKVEGNADDSGRD